MKLYLQFGKFSLALLFILQNYIWRYSKHMTFIILYLKISLLNCKSLLNVFSKLQVTFGNHFTESFVARKYDCPAFYVYFVSKSIFLFLSLCIISILKFLYFNSYINTKFVHTNGLQDNVLVMYMLYID